MITSNLPEQAPETKSDEPLEASSESIIYHTEMPEQKDSLLKKFFLLFRRKSPAVSEEANHEEVEKLTVAPKRTSAQGLHRRAKPSRKNTDPDMRLRAFMTPPMTNTPEKAPKKLNLRPGRENTRRAYWDVAGGLSLILNAILISVLVIMAGQIKNLRTVMDDLLGGLYSNFVDMDKANISTTIPVEAQIPIVFSLPVQQNTDVTLTSAVTIPRTGVVINSGGLSINAPATITLPEGTNLPIALKLDIPVQVTIPISLQIPVNIPLNQTTLHAPFTGLQQTIKPLYCTINRNAQYPQGIFICNEQGNSNAVNP